MQVQNQKNGLNPVLKGYNMLLYFAGSMIMYEPVEECVFDFWSKGILKALPVDSRNPRFIEAASQLRASCNDKTLCAAILQDDYNRLISDSGPRLAPPLKHSYYDYYVSNPSNREEVSEFYNSYGWEKRSKYNTADDNLGIELLFLTLLIDKYNSFDDEICRIEMKEEIRRFIRLHILSWIPYWNDRMQEFSHTLCYKGIATLIYACCEDIYGMLEKVESGFQNDQISEVRI